MATHPMILLTLLALVWMSFRETVVAGDDVGLIRLGETWRINTASSGLPNWRNSDFDDTSWPLARSGFSIGYGSYDESTSLPWGVSSAYLLRKEFVVEDPGRIRWLILRIDYRDGFVAHLNGLEVARRGFNIPPNQPVPPDALALARFRDEPAEIDLSEQIPLLRKGTNVLAIQIHSASRDGYALACVPELLANFLRGPLIQNAATNSVHVTWNTPVPTRGVVEFGLTSALGLSAASSGTGTNHAVALHPLEPGTQYFYRVRITGTNGLEAVSDIASFNTLKQSGDFKLALLGDTGTGSLAQYRVAELIAGARPDLVLHAGDVIYPQFLTSLADLRCFSVYGQHMRNTPYYFAVGNHDLYAGPTHFRNAFVLPTNNVTGNDDYYSFDHGDAHIAVLYVPYLSQHTPVPGDAQHKWLDADLAMTRKPWKIVMLHNPMMTSSAHRYDDQNGNLQYDRLEIRNFLLPLAAKHGVQVVLSGHEHVYERFQPVEGVHSVVSGGGGVGLYYFTQAEENSSQFWITHHGVIISSTNGLMRIQAIDQLGREIDQFILNQRAPDRREHLAKWESLTVETGPADDFDGNITRQEFKFSGAPSAAVTGRHSNLGELRVSNDSTNLYLGLSGVMTLPGQDLLLFLEVPRLQGVTSMTSIGNGRLDPSVEGADALDFAENLGFTNFTPAVGFILGDEYGDATKPSFARSGSLRAMGQGAFLLKTNLPPLMSAKIQQFNRNPQLAPIAYEQNADFIKIAIPLNELGGLQPGEAIRIGAVCALSETNLQPGFQSRTFDNGFIGQSLMASGTNRWVLEPLVFRTSSAGLDLDLDGLTQEEEERLGTNPSRADSDDDGMPDGWEAAHGLDPLKAGQHLDSDGDGASDLQEFKSGTIPRTPASIFKLEAQLEGASQLQLSWQVAPGRRYQIQQANSISGPFMDLSGPDPSTTIQEGREKLRLDLTTNAARFFRIRQLP